MDPSLNTRIDSIINIINKNADSLGGKSRTILLNKNNEIVDVTGLDYKKLMDMPNTYGAALLCRNFGKKCFSKDNLNSMIGQTFQTYPDHPVKVGDTWEKEI